MVTKAELLRGGLQQRESIRKQIEQQRVQLPEEQIVEIPQEQYQVSEEEYTKQYAEESVNKIEGNITDLQQTLEGARQRLQEYNSKGRDTGDTERYIMEIQDKIDNLKAVKNEAATGQYEVQSLINYAYDKAEGRTARAIQRAEPPKYDTSQFDKLGLKPIIDKEGNITGFEDTRLQQSYSVKNIPQSRISELEKAGLIKVETIKTTPAQTLSGNLFNAFISPYPETTIDKTLTQKGLSGTYSKGVITTTGEKSTLMHELGHYYTLPWLSSIPETSKEKIAKEGRFVLGLKYGDYFGGLKDYTPQQYPQEALAIGYSWFSSGNKLKQTAIKLAMPETIKFIESKLYPQSTMAKTTPSSEIKNIFLGKVEEAKAISTEAKRYETMGYTPKEAKKLAEFSYQTQTTPTKKIAEEFGLISKPITLKGDVLGKSGIYYILPYLGQQAIKGIEKVFPKATPIIKKIDIWGEKHPKITGFMQSVAMTSPVFTFFAPAMATGMAGTGESDYVFDYVKGKFVRRLSQKAGLVEAPKASLEDYTIKFERAYASEGEKGVINLLKKYQNIIKQQTNVASKELAIRNVNAILQDLVKKKIIRYVDFNTITGEIRSISVASQYPKSAPFIFKETTKPITIVSKGAVIPKQEIFTPPQYLVYASDINAPTLAGLESLTIPTTKEILEPSMKVSSEISLDFLAKTDEKNILGLGVISLPKLQTKQKQQQKQQLQLKQQQKQIQLLKTQQQLQTKQVQIQVLKTQQQTKQQQVTRQITRNILRTEFGKPQSPKQPPLITLLKGGGKSEILKSALGKVSKGYQTWVKRYGKYKPLTGIRAKGEAIKLGEEFARTTLGASFKITPTEISVKGMEDYLPSPKIFRGYRIKKGRRIPLKEEWIQKAKYRLSAKPEIAEILKAKKSKGGKKLKWL